MCKPEPDGELIRQPTHANRPFITYILSDKKTCFMPFSERVMFPSNRRMIVFLLLLLVPLLIAIFVFINGYGIWVQDYFFNNIPKEELHAKLWVSARVFRLSIFALVAIVAMIVALVIRIVRPRPTLILQSEGIVSNLAPKGLIAWDNIESFRIAKHRGSDNLVINLRDPDRFLSDNGLKRGLTFRGNMAMFKTPIVIPQMRVAERLETLVEDLRAMQTEAAGRHN